MANPGPKMDSASDIAALSKAAWKLGTILSTLDHNHEIPEETRTGLTGDVKTLSHQCDLVYAELRNATGIHEAPQPQNVDSRLKDCLGTQLEDVKRTLHELELLVQNTLGYDASLLGQQSQQSQLSRTLERIELCWTKVSGHIDHLRVIILLVNLVLHYLTPCRIDDSFVVKVDRLRDSAKKLRTLSADDQLSRSSRAETLLMQYSHDVLTRCTALCNEIRTPESKSTFLGTNGNNDVRIAEWVTCTLTSLRQNEQLSSPSDELSNVSSIFSGNEPQPTVTSAFSSQSTAIEDGSVEHVENDSDDDLGIDMIKAALATASAAFEAQEWREADLIFREASDLLKQMPLQRRACCDNFDLQYKLAVCAYYVHDPQDAKEALVAFVEQPTSSDIQRECICNATHLLSLLYIREGLPDQAQIECEKALRARRRLLGTQSEAALMSTALLSHIYVLLNNPARAKVCLAMIPDVCRSTMISTVEESLGVPMEHFDSLSVPTSPVSGIPDATMRRNSHRISASSLAPSMESRCYGPVPTTILQSPATTSLCQSPHSIPFDLPLSEDWQSIAVTSPSQAEDRSEHGFVEVDRMNTTRSAYPEVCVSPSPGSGQPQEPGQLASGGTLSRKEILERIGCHPRDNIEQAVCDGDHTAFTRLLHKKNDFWKSKVRKHVRTERITALHFAALFGEIDMARRLIVANFNINEVPFGYTTTLTPLKFAIGGRQVEMVDFLIASGAKPSEPDSWSTLAGQLMNRSWLRKTMSESQKTSVPATFIAILKILLKHGFNVNAPFEASGTTVLHQAVTFWTGSYSWDRNLRIAVTSFLCERGANPFQANKEGKTPFDMASSCGHQELLQILDRGTARSRSFGGSMDPIELSC